MEKILFKCFCKDESCIQTICINGKEIFGTWVHWDRFGKMIDTQPFFEHIFELNDRLIKETICEAVRDFTDKDGRQVYEGDYVIVNYEGFSINEGVVEYNKNNHRWCIRNYNGLLHNLDEYGKAYIKVIGTKWNIEPALKKMEDDILNKPQFKNVEVSENIREKIRKFEKNLNAKIR